MRPGKKGAVSFTRARQRRVGLSNRVKLRARCTLIWAVQCIGESNYVAAYGTVSIVDLNGTKCNDLLSGRIHELFKDVVIRLPRALQRLGFQYGMFCGDNMTHCLLGDLDLALMH